MLEKHGIACDLMHGFNWKKWTGRISNDEFGMSNRLNFAIRTSAFRLFPVTQVKKIVTIDWTLRESARAKIKFMVKRILNKHGYPPDLQEEAVRTVLAQAEWV